MNYLKFTPLLLLLAFAACKKDSLSKTDMLTDASGWKMTALTTDPAFVNPITGTQITDLYAQFDACDKDDITTFNSNGTYVSDEGATKCDPSDPQTTSGTWLLSADENTITVDGESWTIVELSKSTMKVSYPFVDDSAGITYTWTATFTH